jgi:hypothetical protein
MPTGKDLWFERSQDAAVKPEISTEPAAIDRRCTRRLARAQQVQVRGFDATGRYFSERTQTVDVSDSGCRMMLRIAVSIGSILRVTVLSGAAGASSAAAQFEVVWTRQQGTACELGARLVKGSSPWGTPLDHQHTA